MNNIMEKQCIVTLTILLFFKISRLNCVIAIMVYNTNVFPGL